MKYSVASCSHGVPYGEPCDDCGPVVVPKPAKESGKTNEPMLSHCALCEDPNFLYRDCVVAAITTARKDAREAAWLPIETAPKDGTRILLACDDHVWLDEWWKGDGANSGWASAVAWEQAGGKYTRPPTHWMPLPQPPIEAAANTEEGAGDG